MARRRRSAGVSHLCLEAEKEGRCIVASDRAEAKSLRRGCTSGLLLSPFPQLYALADSWDELKPEVQGLRILRGLQNLHPTWVFAGPSAALALGLSVPRRYLKPVRVVTTSKAHSRSLPHVFRQCVDDDEAVSAGGVQATSLARTTFDCLREMDMPDGLSVADSLLKNYSVSQETLLERMQSFSRQCAGWEHAIETALLADGRADNGGESIARGRMIRLGYEPPDLQVELLNVVEGGAYYGDFGWTLADGTQIIGELDGKDKYVDPTMTHGKPIEQVMREERLRESRIGATGVRVMRFSYADMMDDQQFCKILNAYGVPRATRRYYAGVGEPYKPAGLSASD